MKTAPKSVTELVVALKKAVNAPLLDTKGAKARWEKRVGVAMARLASRLVDA
jgi:hypothetical protein